jgi:iron complex outermembrane receptor protein
MPRRLLLTPTLLLLALTLPAAEAEQNPKQTTPEPTPTTGPSTQEATPLTVTGERETGTYPGSATTANKGSVPTLESPRRVDSITRELIRELDATTATELWKLVPNAVESERGTVIVRGFTLDQRPAAGAQLFDGMRTSVYNLVPVNLYNIERVEILKGPDGVLYGQGQPGGLVNYVLKKPQRADSNEFSLHLDSYGKKQFQIDSTGTLAETSAGDFLFRVDAVGEQTETFRNFEEYKNFRVAPAVSWLPTESTTITVLSELFKDRRTGGRGYGTPVRQGDPFAMPRNYTIADPNDFRETYGGDVQLQVNQRLAEHTALDLTLYSSRVHYWNQYHEGQRNAAEDAADNPVYRRQYRDQTSDTSTAGYDAHLTWERPDHDLSHRLLVGTDLTRIKDPQFPAIEASITNPVSGTNTDGAASLNLDNPYTLPTGTGSYGVDSAEEAHGNYLEAGLYTNYRLGFADRLFFDLGARYDDFQQEASSTNTLTGATNYRVESRDHHVNGDVGVVYKFLPVASVYYGYSSGLAAQGYTTISNVNGPFDPLEWSQHEVGLSTETRDKTLGASLCAFSITRVHDLVPDTSPGAPSGASIDVGETRSNGVEATVRGRIANNTLVSGSYGYTHAYVRESTVTSTFSGTGVAGESLAGVPSNNGNVTVAHTLPMKTVRLFASWTYVGTRPARLDPADPLSFDLPYYWTLDLAATYIQPTWQARLGVNNVFDRDYVVLYRATGHQVNRGDPQTFTGSFTTWF